MIEISRRDFLRGTGVLLVGFRVGGGVASEGAGPQQGASSGLAAAMQPDLPIGEVDSYLAIGRDGTVTITTGRIDMGTGNQTCFAQFVADELDVAIDRIKIIGGDTALTPDGGKTTASDAVPIGGQPLRVSAATARHKLLHLASQRFGVPVEQLTVNDGVVSVTADPSRRAAYGDLIANGRFEITLEVDRITVAGPLLKLPAGVTLKDPKQYKYIGKPIPRFDVPDRVIRSVFCQNVRVQGMLHGRCVRPDAVGATVVSVDERSVNSLPGYVQLVVRGNFVGVVFEREEQAVQAQRQLKVTWSKGTGLPASDNVFQNLRSQPEDKRLPRPVQTSNEGNVEAALASAAKVLTATYEYPWNAHAMLGPTCAVADVKNDRATVWSGTQWPRYTQKDVALLLGLAPERVRVICVPESGSYGRLAAADAAGDAALLSQAVGRPVRVQWSRAEEHAWAPHMPPYVVDFRAGLDAHGSIVAWDAEAWSSSTHDAGRGGGLLAQRLIGKDPGPRDPLGAPRSGVSDDYSIPNVRSSVHTVVPLLRAVFMRAPGGIQTAFAIESFMDELAAAAGEDPLDFRLKCLPPGLNVDLLRIVRKASGWTSRRSPNPDAGGSARVLKGRGYAVGEDDSHMVVEVEVDRQTGKVTVTEAWVAFSPGLIVNPDGLVNQVEQAALQAFSRSLMEEVRFDNSKVTTVDWTTFPILRLSDVPKMHTTVVNRPDLDMTGAGEPGTTPAAGAIGNAIFDATGVRIRRVPFTPVRVLAALKTRRT